MAPTLDITDQIRNVEPGDYQVSVALHNADGSTVLVSKSSPVTVPVPTPLDEDPPTVKVS